MYLPSINNSELIRYAEQTLDPLTSTDLERELLKRFVALLAESEVDNSFAAVLEDFDYTHPEDLRADSNLAAAVREAVDNNQYQPIDN